MKTVIVYFSKHHGNTKKLAEAIAEKYPVELIDLAKQSGPDVSGYDRIGLASGIYAGSFAKQIMRFVRDKLPSGKQVFLMSTSAGPKQSYEKSVRKLLEQKTDCTIIGSYMCEGFNTFGPTKLFGGTAKGHPTQEEIDDAVRFYGGLNNDKSV